MGAAWHHRARSGAHHRRAWRPPATGLRHAPVVRPPGPPRRRCARLGPRCGGYRGRRLCAIGYLACRRHAGADPGVFRRDVQSSRSVFALRAALAGRSRTHQAVRGCQRRAGPGRAWPWRGGGRCGARWPRPAGAHARGRPDHLRGRHARPRQPDRPAPRSTLRARRPPGQPAGARPGRHLSRCDADPGLCAARNGVYGTPRHDALHPDHQFHQQYRRTPQRGDRGRSRFPPAARSDRGGPARQSRRAVAPGRHERGAAGRPWRDRQHRRA